MAESSPSGGTPPTPESTLASSLLSVVQPAVHKATQALVELQTSQLVLGAAISSQRGEVLEGSQEWQQARAALDLLPAYIEKVAAIRRQQAATAALADKLDKGASALLARVEEKERQRAEKRGADAAGFAAVAQK